DRGEVAHQCELRVSDLRALRVDLAVEARLDAGERVRGRSQEGDESRDQGREEQCRNGTLAHLFGPLSLACNRRPVFPNGSARFLSAASGSTGIQRVPVVPFSATRRTPACCGVPWLCVPVSQRVCPCRGDRPPIRISMFETCIDSERERLDRTR